MARNRKKKTEEPVEHLRETLPASFGAKDLAEERPADATEGPQDAEGKPEADPLLPGEERAARQPKDFQGIGLPKAAAAPPAAPAPPPVPSRWTVSLPNEAEAEVVALDEAGAVEAYMKLRHIRQSDHRPKVARIG